MAIRFLLDEHISPRVAELATRLGIDTLAVCGSEWEGADDEALLREAARQGRILVTYNVGDFAGCLDDALLEGLSLPGVVYVSRATIPSSNFSSLARALVRLARRIEAGEVSCSVGIFLAP